MKYFLSRTYIISGLRIRDFFRQLDQTVAEQGLRRNGALMGLGIAYQEIGSGVLGSVQARYSEDGVKIEVSTLRKSVLKYLVLSIIFTYGPYIIGVAYLMKIGIISITEFVVLLISYASIFILLIYEYSMGIFPKSRRMQKELMKACDRVVYAGEGKAKTPWKMIMKWVKTRESSLGLFTYPDEVDPSKFIE